MTYRDPHAQLSRGAPRSASSLVLVLVAASAFAAGRWSDPPPPGLTACPEADAAGGGGLPRSAPVSRDAMARTAAEAGAKLEGLRDQIVASCGGVVAGPVKVRLKLAFDASGREVARAVAEEHHGDGGAFGGCLTRLSDTALTVSPPGAPVAVTVSALFP